MFRPDPFSTVHDPDPALKWRSRRAVYLLLIAFCPVVFWALRGDLAGPVFALLVLGLAALAAFFLVQGIERDRQRRVARWPRKLFGSLLLAVDVAFMAFLQDLPPLVCAALGAAGLVLAIVGFGPDRALTFRLRLRRLVSDQGVRRFHLAERVLRTLPVQMAALRDPRLNRRTAVFRDRVLARLASDPWVLDHHGELLIDLMSEAAVAADALMARGAAASQVEISEFTLLLADLADGLDLVAMPGPEDAPEDEGVDGAEDEDDATAADARAVPAA